MKLLILTLTLLMVAGCGGTTETVPQPASSEVTIRADYDAVTEQQMAQERQLVLVRQNQPMVDANQSLREEIADARKVEEWREGKAQWQAKIADSRFRAPIKAAEDFKVAISDQLNQIIAENEGDPDAQTRAYIEFISLAQRADNHLADMLAQRDALAVEGLEEVYAMEDEEILRIIDGR